MPAALLALPTIFALISKVEVGVELLIAWVQKIRAAAKQSGEWTPEMETAFLDSVIAMKTDPAYQPDPPAAVNVLPAPPA